MSYNRRTYQPGQEKQILVTLLYSFCVKKFYSSIHIPCQSYREFLQTKDFRNDLIIKESSLNARI